MNYGYILYFIKFYVKCFDFTFCLEFCFCKVVKYYVIVECLVRDNNIVFLFDIIIGVLVLYIVFVLFFVNEIVVILLGMIVKIFSYVDFGIGGKSFVVSFLNMFEKD